LSLPLRSLERAAVRFRHLPGLDRADGLWRAVTPVYDAALASVARDGLVRVINGTDRVRVLPRCRHISEVYEPATWARLMAEVRPGDTVVDVGASVGLYTLGFARRVGPTGRMVAFEPDPASADILAAHVALNRFEDRVTVRREAVTDQDGAVAFEAGREVESHVVAGDLAAGAFSVPSVKLDSVFEGTQVAIVKVDVEGAEKAVLDGAQRILRRAEPPRLLAVELHPQSWAPSGTTLDTLIGMVQEAGYEVSDASGDEIKEAHAWTEMFCTRKGAA